MVELLDGWTISFLGTVGTVAALALVIMAVQGVWIFKDFKIKSPSRRQLITVLLGIWVVAAAVSGGLITSAQSPGTAEISPIASEYDVTVTESHSHVTVNELTNTVTIMLDRNATSWESAAQYCNLSFSAVRTDASISDSTVVFDVTSVDSWLENDGTTNYVLSRYSNGEFYTDWNEYGSTATTNDKFSIMIDRDTESSARANLTMVCGIADWLDESQGDSHSVVVTLSDPSSDWVSTWTLTFILSNTS